MPEIPIEQAISQATADVLEKMFFTGFAAESDGIEDAGPRITVRLAFDGEGQGLLVLGISKNSARTLAADFLGTDTEDGPGEAQVNEVVRELANMICGDALSALEKSALCLSVPEIVPPADSVLPEGSIHRSFDLGNGALTVGLFFRGGANG
jgi:CheY-specific phosphatase CheX